MMDEELRNLQLDRLDKRGKSAEQIKKHSLDANLENKPIEKAIYLLTKGDEVQKLSVIENLPNLIKTDSFATFNRIVPKIQNELPHSSSEFHVTTSRIFQLLITNHFKSDSNLTGTILQGLDARDSVVASAWLETLLQVILVLPIKIVQTEILPVAILKGQCLQSVPSRVASCKILGRIVLHQQMKPIEIKKDILPVVYSLCQDVNYTVRAAICEQIPLIAKGLGANMVKNFLLSNLVELSSDDNSNVRAIAVSSVVQVLPYLDKETKTNTMVPLVMNLCSTNKKLEEAASVVLAKEMGLLLTSLESCLLSYQAEVLITFYQHLAKRGLNTRDLSIYNVDPSQDVKSREFCAANFPAVMSFTINTFSTNINVLYDVFRSLTIDPCYIVRLTVGGVFHDVARILGPRNQMMKSEFVRLLRDDAEEVLQMLVPNISTILLLFLNHGTLSMDRTDAVSTEIGKAMLKCLAQLLKGYNWRLTTTFVRQLETLPMVFKSEHIYNDFTPQLMKCALVGRTKPVRSQTVRTLLYFLRWNTKLMQRTWLRDHLIHELAESKCSYTRHVFIDMCIQAMDIFSNKYFKENFLIHLLNLANDKVSTVRYCVVALLPRIRKIIQRTTNDQRLLQRVQDIITHMERDETDKDVLEILTLKTKEMASPAFQMETKGQETLLKAQERRLVEEEEQVLRGKITPTISVRGQTRQETHVPQPVMQARSGGRSASVNRSGPKSNVSSPPMQTRSTSVPRPQREIISDMTFLKQHFYTDAGVDLPATTPTSVTTTENVSDELTDLSLNSDVNMTDDVKVNMRRRKIPTAVNFKRHSIIGTGAETETTTTLANGDNNTNTNMNKRRSLNIVQQTNKEISKIPVIITNSKKETRKLQSNLPVRIK